MASNAARSAERNLVEALVVMVLNDAELNKHLRHLRILKTLKILLAVFCMVCAAVLVNSGYSNSDWNYCLAAAIIWFICELVFLIFYLTPLGKLWTGHGMCHICRLVYHIIMVIFVFAACVCLVLAGMDSIAAASTAAYKQNSSSIFSFSGGYKVAAEGYNAFGILTIVGVALDIYMGIEVILKYASLSSAHTESSRSSASSDEDSD